jgi:CPA2 family monovalent cation:H+ antiporter-2
MLNQPLSQVLILLAAAVLVVALARRLGLPSLLGYICVGIALGPHAFALFRGSSNTQLLADLGVAFLLFTIGLEFSFPRMIALRREVFGLGAAQVLATASLVAGLAFLGGVTLPVAIVVGGAVAMSSTAVIVQQLTERSEINRTHGRLAFSILLFQDLAFVPFLALAGLLVTPGAGFSFEHLALAIGGAAVAVAVVIAAGQWLLRPLFYEIAHSRLRELFTLAVLLVVLGSAWVSSIAGLSLSLGAFLSGMMLAETEYRHQIDSVIRPFRDLLVGVFFISVGMLLDTRLLYHEFWVIFSMVVGMFVIKTAVGALVTRLVVDAPFKALRTGLVIGIGGEFGVALLSVILQAPDVEREILQPLLVAMVLSLVLSPLLLANNKRIARLILGQRRPPASVVPTALARDLAATEAVAKREHVIICGYGRVGQSVARVLESQGFEYIALDLDPARVRAARQAGDTVLYGDSADEEMLARVGLEAASAVLITFASPSTALGIVRSVRRVRAEVPILVRTEDDSRLEELKQAGATEVVPETFEASLMLVSQALMLLKVPMSRIVRTVGDIRDHRYAAFRTLFKAENVLAIDGAQTFREELRSVVLPPGAWAVGRTIEELRERGAEAAFTGVRRQGILGRDPEGNTSLREGDIVVIYGEPATLEHAEAVMLVGQQSARRAAPE